MSWTDPVTLSTFQGSLDRCIIDPTFLARFYARFTSTSSDAAARFAHVDMARQERVLRASLYMVLRAAQGAEDGLQHLAEIAESHSKKRHDIRPAEYGHWLDSLLHVVRECDPRCDEATERAWRACVQPCIDRMIARHAELE